jgi:type II secretory pathway pseudopilin PulG
MVHRRASAAMRRSCGAFTIVEMLVVVSIILIVVSVALPAMSSLSKSASRRGAITLMLSALDQARALAIAQGGNVYVVFADGNPVIPDDYRFRSFAVFQQVYYPEQKATGNPYFYEQLRPWTKLPEGVAFKPDGTDKVRTLFDAASKNRQKFAFRMNHGTAGGGASGGTELELPFLKFNSTGGLDGASGDPQAAEHARLRLFEGYFAPDGTPVATTGVSPSGTRKYNPEAVLEVSIFTGRAAKREADEKSETPNAA